MYICVNCCCDHGEGCAYGGLVYVVCVSVCMCVCKVCVCQGCVCMVCGVQWVKQEIVYV